MITLRRADYEKVRAQIHDLPGTVFQEGQQLLAPSRPFAQPLLGRIGRGHRGRAQGGRRRLRRRRPARRLRPAAGAERPAHRHAGAADLGDRRPECSPSARPGRHAVRTTLDRSVQTAADSAVATATEAGRAGRDPAVDRRDPRGRRQRAGPVRDRAGRPVPGRLHVQDPHLDRAAAGEASCSRRRWSTARHHGRLRQGVPERGPLRPRPDRRCGGVRALLQHHLHRPVPAARPGRAGPGRGALRGRHRVEAAGARSAARCRCRRTTPRRRPRRSDRAGSRSAR